MSKMAALGYRMEDLRCSGNGRDAHGRVGDDLSVFMLLSKDSFMGFYQGNEDIF